MFLKEDKFTIQPYSVAIINANVTINCYDPQMLYPLKLELQLLVK